MAKVHVVLVAGDSFRYTEAAGCCLHMAASHNYRWFVEVGSIGLLCVKLNEGIQAALDAGSSHILFMADDHMFKPDLVEKLLAHNKDIVGPLVTGRSAPYILCVFRSTPETGETGIIQRAPSKEAATKGLQKVWSGAVMLVKRRVFEKLSRPWFTLNQWDAEITQEDLNLHYKMEQAGFEAYTDFDTRIGHISTVGVWPGEDGGVVLVPSGGSRHEVIVK